MNISKYVQIFPFQLLLVCIPKPKYWILSRCTMYSRSTRMYLHCKHGSRTQLFCYQSTQSSTYFWIQITCQCQPVSTSQRHNGTLVTYSFHHVELILYMAWYKKRYMYIYAHYITTCIHYTCYLQTSKCIPDCNFVG